MPLEIVRVWHEPKGWMHEVWDTKNNVLAASRSDSEMMEQYPDAKPSGIVICGDNIYEEKWKREY